MLAGTSNYFELCFREVSIDLQTKKKKNHHALVVQIASMFVNVSSDGTSYPKFCMLFQKNIKATIYALVIQTSCTLVDCSEGTSSHTDLLNKQAFKTKIMMLE